ncbi:MAG: hypothetical protein M1825_004224 [Sarcosagium campestre]|nr:MAG: hypothetical protein M1825_004224 [Sarcosagium campestre]
MSASQPSRPSRRAATRRKAVVESSDEDDHGDAKQAQEPQQQKQLQLQLESPDLESEDDFAPAPLPASKSSPKKQTRRKTAIEPPLTPRSPPGARRTTSASVLEPSALFDEESPIVADPVSTLKRTVSPKKKMMMSSLPIRGRGSIAPNIPMRLTTPQPARLLHPSTMPHQHVRGLNLGNVPATPLADITNATMNDAAVPMTAPFKSRSLDPLMEKPMDIVLKSRSLLPQSPQKPPEAKPRIVLTYLVLQNFKSYAGRQEVGPFHASFSSVVGPNGSGKSNVIDSLLFVFGFRASKMRQGKISALIHNSAAHPDLAYCEVEVHFQEVIDQPGGSHEIVPESTLIISRKAFRNNSSKYYINGKESNFTTVTTLLKERGVDLDHKRFLILQGEVESIAQMKPKAATEHDDGLLEYLEDIIGTSMYKAPIEESATELDSLNEVCVEKSSRVQHVEKEKNGLEEKKNKALAFVKDENEMVTKQSALYQVYLDECNDNLKVSEETIGQLQAQLDEESTRHQGNEDGIKELQKQYKKGTKQFEALEKDTQAVLKDMAKFDKENVKFEERRKFLTGKQKKLEKTLQASRLSASESANSIKNHTEDAERNAAEIASLEKSIEAEEKELSKIRDSLKGKTQKFSDEITVKQKALEPWNQKINEKQSAMAVAQSELDILREKGNASAVALEEIHERIRSIEQTREEKLQELEQCKSERARLVKEAKSMQVGLDEMAKSEPELRASVSGARQKADEARASLSNTQTQGNVLTGLMRLKESGRIKGFHGRLGNLGTIDQKYDVAISTACPSLDNLVVDAVEVGQQCIEYLRKNSLGRANIICLDKLPRRDVSAVKTPENAPRLFDLVKAKDARFASAFFSVLQNTLVADDLVQANRIAYGAQRWRVVTLDGQLIDKSGTMSGGGTRVAKGGMSSKLAADTTKEQVAKLEADRDAVEEKLKGFQDKHREAEAALKRVEAEIPDVETKIEKLGLEVESSNRNLADAQRRVKEVKAEHQPSKSDDKRVAALEKKCAAFEAEIATLHAESSGVEEEIRKLQDKIMEIGGVALRSQKAKVDGLRQQINTLSEEISSAEVSKAKAEKQKTKHEKAHEAAQQELQSIAHDLETLDAEVKKQSTIASDSKQKGEEAQEVSLEPTRSIIVGGRGEVRKWRRKVTDWSQKALDTKREELAALKADLDGKTAELNEIRAAEIEMRNKLEESQKGLVENQKRSQYWQDKLSKLTLHKISDLGEEEASDELPIYTKDELLDMQKEDLKAEIALLEEKTQNANADLAVLAEYRRRVEEHASRSSDLAGAVSSRDEAKSRCDDLRKRRLEGFMEGFSTISLRLKEMYQMITMGGNAELELVDSLDPFSEGILFSVMPPKKSWKNISNLSGGEKTLSSLALVFALHHYKPTPLYVMDEIDAALDFRNVSIVASYIKERTKNAQFIVISLRNNMFELASRLVGVYKVNHMTKSITIENRDYINAPNAPPNAPNTTVA